MVKKNRQIRESYSDIDSNNVWDAYDIALEYLGAEELCGSLAKAMGTDALEENLKYIFRTWDIPFGDDVYEESVRRSVRESIDLEADGYKYVTGKPGYKIYRKDIRDNNGRVTNAVWAAQKLDNKTFKPVGEPFEITYDQARGFDPIDDAGKLGRKVANALGLRRESKMHEDLSDELICRTCSNFKVEQTDTGTWVVKADSKRFGKQAIVFEGSSRREALNWMYKHIQPAKESVRRLSKRRTMKESGQKSYWRYNLMDVDDDRYYDKQSIRHIELIPCDNPDACYDDFDGITSWAVCDNDYGNEVFCTKDQAYSYLLDFVNRSMYEREHNI